MFYNFSLFCKAFNGFNQLWCDDRALSKILCSTIPISVHDLKIKVTDFEFFCVKSLQFQLLQSLWLIWIVFGMNGYKILKCFRKEKRVSGELPCPATGLMLMVLSCRGSFVFRLWVSNVGERRYRWRQRQSLQVNSCRPNRDFHVTVTTGHLKCICTSCFCYFLKTEVHPIIHGKKLLKNVNLHFLKFISAQLKLVNRPPLKERHLCKSASLKHSWLFSP